MTTRTISSADPAALLSPHDVASVLGVSESTVKRWVDLSRLQAERTGGGHRRVRWAEVLRFAAANDQALLRGSLATTNAASQAGPFRTALATGDLSGAEVALARAWAACTDAVQMIDLLVVGTWTADRTAATLTPAARTALAPLEQNLREVLGRMATWTRRIPLDAPLAVVGWTGHAGDALVGSAFASVLALAGFRVHDLGTALHQAEDAELDEASAIFLADPWGPLGLVQGTGQAAILVERCRARQLPCLRTSNGRGGLDWRDALVWAESRCLALAG